MSAMKTDIANCGGSDVSGEEHDKDSENHDDHVLFAADAFAEMLSCCCVFDNPTTHKRGSERKNNTGDNKRNIHFTNNQVDAAIADFFARSGDANSW